MPTIDTVSYPRKGRLLCVFVEEKAYDRLHLHLPKQYCTLPHMEMPADWPKYPSRQQFVQYLDDYADHFNIRPMYRRSVESGSFDESRGKWNVVVRNGESGELEEYSGRFLVVASGETSDALYRTLMGSVLVVGSGNSGMEIALDLSNCGAKTSIVVRSPLHMLSREMVNLGLALLKYIPYNMVDSLMVILSKLVYGDLNKYGITRPEEGPFFLKVKYGKYPVVNTGTFGKIKSGEIQVLPKLIGIRGDEVVFEGGKSHPFDAIVFATGFKRSTSKWLKGDDYLLNEDGLPKPSFPNHWKGKNGLYCAGLARRGLYGSALDAQNIANDIKTQL
ncbi:putative indole-3-pyruvate monooxygenase YUCCA10 [Vitis vinifera]|uniref:Flavin-containing monooxygenase n=1 Tax=Vitis vinifera TaxID=29760 RepID=A0A438KIE7_VITVI|nr:putative indole-3-pyruvate monooxygenase YUCCA10 [Vitis vinifera]